MEAYLLFVALAVLSAVVVRLMVSAGTLDVPVDRSSHTVPTPKGGGVGIVAAFAAGMAWQLRAGNDWPIWTSTLAASLALAVVCYWDDIRDWPFAVKLLAQIVAALAVMVCGHVALGVALPGLGLVPLGVAGFVLSLGWILFVTNAVNFIDGLNGLAAGCTLIACLFAGAASPGLLGVPAFVLAAGLAGFLPFNYPKARIFMGDIGSQACGFLVADFALVAATETRASLVVPLALLPILGDAAFTLVRRAVAGARLTQAHRGHLYQVAQRAGMAAWRVTALYWAMTAWGGLCGLLAGRGAGLWVTPLACVAAGAPLLPWVLTVRRSAKRAGITRW